MKSNFSPLVALALLIIGTQAAASERALCQAGYPVMLMMDTECKTYLAKRTSLQKSGDLAALQMLDARVQEELMERALACPCAAEQPVTLALSQSDGC